VGKFADFTDTALDAIKALGITHIWYTGVLHHAMVTDYSAYGLPGDDISGYMESLDYAMSLEKVGRIATNRFIMLPGSELSSALI